MATAEREHLAAVARPDGCRLACRARLSGDVEVPGHGRIHRQLVRKPNEAHASTVRPVVTLHVRYSVTLSMIPDCPLERVTSAGNAAGTGAWIALPGRQSRRLIQRRVEEIERVDTATGPGFHEHFVAALAIPRASDPFDGLRSVVALPARNQRRSNAGR
jgi:uncharacterized 2Fe-2S/4Fe-4S cluster protein (DUF4445 family)